MFVRSITEIENSNDFVDWGNETSYRLLIKQDRLGFAVSHTVVRAGTQSELQYRNHQEACYCIEGEGEVEDMEGTVYPIRKGDVYVLNKHDRYFLRGSKDKDLTLVSVFIPSLQGPEHHNLQDTSGSAN